jgi:hypothetical protein
LRDVARFAFNDDRAGANLGIEPRLQFDPSNVLAAVDQAVSNSEALCDRVASRRKPFSAQLNVTSEAFLTLRHYFNACRFVLFDISTERNRFDGKWRGVQDRDKALARRLIARRKRFGGAANGFAIDDSARDNFDRESPKWRLF